MSIVDTSCELPTEMADDWGPNKPRAQWMAHRNAVFDLSWCNVRGRRVWQSWVHKQGRHAWRYETVGGSVAASSCRHLHTLSTAVPRHSPQASDLAPAVCFCLCRTTCAC